MATKSFTQRKRIRKSFGRIEEVAPMPNLIEVQKASYDGFLQINLPPEDRTSFGLQAVFESVFPIKDFAENGTLEFVKFRPGARRHLDCATCARPEIFSACKRGVSPLVCTASRSIVRSG